MQNERIDVFWAAILCALALGLFFVATACQFTPEEAGARDELIALHDEITADGIITDEERERFVAKAQEAESSINWTELIGASLTSILLSIFGVNAVRNRNLPGTRRKSPS